MLRLAKDVARQRSRLGLCARSESKARRGEKSEKSLTLAFGVVAVGLKGVGETPQLVGGEKHYLGCSTRAVFQHGGMWGLRSM